MENAKNFPSPMKNSEKRNLSLLRGGFMILVFTVINFLFMAVTLSYFDSTKAVMWSYLLGCSVSLAVILKITKKNLRAYNFKARDALSFLLASIALILFNFSVYTPVHQIFLLYFNIPTFHLSGAFDDVYDFVTVLFVAPFFEEFVFRGIVLDGLLKKQKMWVAIVFTSLLFSAMHLKPFLGPSLFAFSLFIGWIYYRTANLWLVIWLHLLNNLVSSIQAYELQDLRLEAVGLHNIYGPNTVLILGLADFRKDYKL
ncbi:lysostaphin resistance A-like protein [Maribacter sp. 2307ULW6-5]|uniref:CPBP family intramembrane glutamic endopeptidase n=1 Tax=Maribacter sp. 2307ULW6-5 TaxID=3386275 RepID=UPI0039BCB437